MKKILVYQLLLLLILACGGGGGSKGDGGSTGAPAHPALSWTRNALKPLTSVDPGAPDSDLDVFGAMVGTAHVVGLGEATHGTSEFQRMKHRLFRYLVEKKGFRAFGLEADMANCMPIDRYIRTGEGDPEALVEGNGFWCWSSREVLDLVQWMRVYNADPSHTEKLRFFGFDNQFGQSDIASVQAYVGRVDPAAQSLLTGLYDRFRPYANTWRTSYYGGATTPSRYNQTEVVFRTQTRADLNAAYQWLLDHQVQCISQTGEEDFVWALRLAKVILQLEEDLASIDTPDFSNLSIRDSAMAENAAWFLDRMGPNGKVALWAHNGHLNRTQFVEHSAWINMGHHLSERFGNGFFSVGFSFYSGQVRAWVPVPGGGYRLEASQVVPTPPSLSNDSFDALLAATGHSLGILDLRSLDSQDPGQAWWRMPHWVREIGLVFDPSKYPTTWYFSSTVGTRFDALVFIKNSSPINITGMDIPLWVSGPGRLHDSDRLPPDLLR